MLDSIAIGAGILAAGGGGNPYIGELRTRQAIGQVESRIMRCTNCLADTYVLDTRQRNDNITQRRRWCPSCEFRFTTSEIPNNHDLLLPHPKPKADRQVILHLEKAIAILKEEGEKTSP